MEILLTIENILLVGSLLLLISILVGKTSYKFGVPTLLLFLGVGILAGSEGIGKIRFDNPQVAQFIGIVSLNFILFSGGLDTNWTSVKPILKEGISLSTVGVLITAIALGLFVWAITDFTIYESLMLGSIVSSTDAAAVFSILRSKSLALKSNLRSTLELESGSNDSMAYVLTIAFLSLVVNQDQSLLSIIPLFFQEMLVGTIAGFAFGKLNRFIINNLKLDFEGLYPVLVIALMFITFSTTNSLGGNGFLSIYIAAVYLGSNDLVHKKTILKMFDGYAWLMQIILFLTLGLLVYPSELFSVVGVGLLISLFLILVARPVGVLLSLIPFKMKMRRRLYISWVGLRGAVPIVFATYPLLAGIEAADTIFNLVFFISVTSLLIQGTTLSVVAKWLHVALPEKAKQVTKTDKLLSDIPKSLVRELEISPGEYPVGKKLVDLAFPADASIAMIKRKEKYIIPGGTTKIEAEDKLVILLETADSYDKVLASLSIPDIENNTERIPA